MTRSATATKPARLALVLALLGPNALGGCSVAGPSGSPADPPVSVPSESAAASISPSVSPSPTPPAASRATTLPSFDSPIPAAAWLLEQSSARFDLRIDRFKPGLPDEITAIASGVVDPAGDRGTMRFEVFPDVRDDGPLAMDPIDITWDPDDYWTTAGTDPGAGTWKHATRDRAHEVAWIGRVNEEPLALFRLAVAADPATIRPLPDGVLDGVPAQRWLVPIPADRTRDAFVPPDSYLGFATIFGLDALPLEIWLVEGRIARVGHVLEREKAPYGGPDRSETWYAWSAFGDPIDLAIPPEGTIVELES
jgi:hypothetical protein